MRGRECKARLGRGRRGEGEEGEEKTKGFCVHWAVVCRCPSTEPNISVGASVTG